MLHPHTTLCPTPLSATPYVPPPYHLPHPMSCPHTICHTLCPTPIPSATPLTICRCCSSSVGDCDCDSSNSNHPNKKIHANHYCYSSFLHRVSHLTELKYDNYVCIQNKSNIISNIIINIIINIINNINISYIIINIINNIINIRNVIINTTSTTTSTSSITSTSSLTISIGDEDRNCWSCNAQVSSITCNCIC